jgi:hypothetical protein
MLALPCYGVLGCSVPSEGSASYVSPMPCLYRAGATTCTLYVVKELMQISLITDEVCLVMSEGFLVATGHAVHSFGLERILATKSQMHQFMLRIGHTQIADMSWPKLHGAEEEHV